MMAGGREIADHLVARGLAREPSGLRVALLEGGVSNEVFAVTGPGVDVVVKRALGRLRVETEWLADTRRLQTEGRALRLAGELQPGSVPRVLDLDEQFLVIERAPHDWLEWRTRLLSGVAEPRIARVLGETLGAWQARTAAEPALVSDFADRTGFHQLRVDPFHRTVLDRHPELAGPISAVIERMLARQTCLVHGDYTPKNVLVPGDPAVPALWVLDWEVAHLGDEDFDPASMLAHLLIKTVHLPASAGDLRACAGAFLSGLRGSGLRGSADEAHLIGQVGCMLLARVDGKSPAKYLTAPEQHEVRELGRILLARPPAAAVGAWELTR
jgi:aminoglycoside phosphotransferase (APT) family kinase protein